jgi:ComF family protein
MVTALQGFLQSLVRAGDSLLAEAFQTRCVSCDKRSTYFLCEQCHWLPKIPLAPGSYRQAALLYREPWRTVLHSIKFHGKRQRLQVFQPLFTPEAFDFVPEKASVVPVPIHYSTLRARGFNQSEWLAIQVAKAARLPLECDLLRKKKATPPQSLRKKRDRHKGLSDVFQCENLQGTKAVLLVDDVFTSGATFEACERALRKGGVEQVYFWSLFQASLPKMPGLKKEKPTPWEEWA